MQVQVKLFTSALPQFPEITWPKETVRRAIALIENIYHRIFGCWHTNMSRPFTINQETYRMCLDCGAHRAFDTQQWKMVGPYYARSSSIKDLYRCSTLMPTKVESVRAEVVKVASRPNLRRVA
jgi:hypothetical protein